MKRLTRTACALVAAAAIALTAACGSSSPSDSGGSSGSADTAGLKAAQDYIGQNAANPTSIGLTELPKAPPTGKKVIMLLVSPQPVALRVANAMDAASKVLGWDFSTINAGGTPAETVKAFDAALAKSPDVICPCGTGSSTLFKKQIDEANKRGITIIQNVVADGPIDGVLANVAGADQQDVYGKLVAAEFISGTKGKGTVALFNINAFPILKAFTDSFVKAVKEWCPRCSVDTQNQQLADVGTKTPANVVAYLQRHPDVKYAAFGNGDLALGVSAAIKTAGLKGIKIIGESPSKANLEALKTGDETAWAGYPVEMMGWRTIDVLARHFVDADVAAAVAVPLSGQMITPDTIGTVAMENGEYVAVAGYQDQFKKIWKIQ